MMRPVLGVPAAAMEALDKAAAASHFPALAVAVTGPDGIIFERYYGSATNADTLFLLGSLSKSFTALCILQLVDAGVLALDAPASAYVTGAPEVTIRELLTHSGGFDTYQTDPLQTPAAGSGPHVYANVNYTLLGRIIEAVTDEDYASYLGENVLHPLDMDHTTASPVEAERLGLAAQYENWFGFPLPSKAHFPDAGGWIQAPAGYISASTRDMARYLQMYLRGGEDIVSEAALRSIFTETVPVDDDGIPYAYGFGWTVITEPLSQTVYRHAGLVETGTTCMYILPEEQLGVILMADSNDFLVGHDLLDRIGWNLVLSLLGETPGTVGSGEYWLRHGLLDLLYGGLLAAAGATWCLLPRFRRRLHDFSGRHLLAAVAGFGIVPAVLVLVPVLFLGTPLWVVAAFVPDLYLVLWMTAALLWAGGAARLWLLWRSTRMQGSGKPRPEH